MRRAQLGNVGNAVVQNLTIVLAIIVIVVAVVIPLYFDYVKRSRVSEGLALAEPARAAVEKAFAAKEPADMSQRANTGWTPPAPTEHLPSVAIAKHGAITPRFAESVAPQGENEIQIVPVSAAKAIDLSNAASARKKFEWQCGGAAGKSTLAEKFRPKDCR